MIQRFNNIDDVYVDTWLHVGRCVIRTAPWASFTWKAWCSYPTCEKAWIALTTSRASAIAAARAHIHGDLPGGTI